MVAGLRSRGLEVAEEIHASIPASGTDPLGHNDAGEYEHGRVAAIAATIEYSLDAIEQGGEWGEMPQALADHARRAARIGMRPGVLVRRYLAGHGRFMDFIREEIERTGYAGHEAVLEHLRENYGSLLDHIVASVEDEYERESEHLACSPEYRCAKLVRRLIVEDLDSAELKELNYEVGFRWHLGVIAVGAESAEALRRLGTSPGPKLLMVAGDDDETVWAWLASKTKLSVSEFKCLLATSGCRRATLAIGDPGNGLKGWRQTHDEAQLALLIARHKPQEVTRCVEVLPVVAATQNDAMLRIYGLVYLQPLNSLHGCGLPARKSLLAYFKHGRNASSAGKAIGLTRRTVENHLCDVRKVLGDPLDLTALEIALRLEELGYIDAGTKGTELPSIVRR